MTAPLFRWLVALLLVVCADGSRSSSSSRRYTTNSACRRSCTVPMRMSSTDVPRSKRDVGQQEARSVLVRGAAAAATAGSSLLLGAAAPTAAAATTVPSPAPVDMEAARRVIESGHVYVQNNYLPLQLVQGLRDEIGRYVELGKFKASGLSNFAKGAPGASDKQGFNPQKDRNIAPITFSAEDISPTMLRVGEVVDELRLALADGLRRPTMADISLNHESYFSRSLPGSSLARHMDEFHEETKGRRGWTTASRRSVSWLLYLCEDTWDVATNGGGLCAFPQTRPVVGRCGADEGNLQVGWWDAGATGVQPVFMDCWRKEIGSAGAAAVAKAALYVQTDGPGRRRYLTSNFDVRDPNTGAALDSYAPFFATSADAQRFYKVEDIPAWQAGQIPAGSAPQVIAPRGGSLVLFDSVALPHEVMTTLAGERLALAGWMHERQQPFPSWYMG